MAMDAPNDDSGLLLLGEDFPTFGELHVQTLAGGDVAGAISAGVDPHSPARENKGSPDFPNEDGLFALSRGTRGLLAVADAHFGHRASHDLLRAIARWEDEIPEDLQTLAAALEGLPPRDDEDASESTLLVAVHDRATGAGFGYSFGDSALAVVGPERAEILTSPEPFYVAQRAELLPRVQRAQRLEFRAEPGEVILVFTDGIHECHYTHPETSLGVRQLRRCFDVCGDDPRCLAERIARLAMRGVSGNPGGQDNLALVARRVGPVSRGA